MADACDQLSALSAVDACHLSSTACRGGGLIPYNQIQHCWLGGATGVLPALFAVLLVIWLGALFVNMSHVAEAFLAPVLLRLSSQLKCPPRLTAVTFLAWANEAPDISSNVAAIRQGRYKMALGSCVGSGMMIVCLIGGLLIRMADSKLRVRGAMVRDISTYVVATGLLLFALSSGTISRLYIVVCVTAYACYVLAVALADFHHRGWLPHQRRGKGARTARRRIMLPGFLARVGEVDIGVKLKRSAKRWGKTRQRVARTLLVRVKRSLKAVGVGGATSPSRKKVKCAPKEIVWTCSPITAYRAEVEHTEAAIDLVSGERGSKHEVKDFARDLDGRHVVISVRGSDACATDVVHASASAADAAWERNPVRKDAEKRPLPPRPAFVTNTKPPSDAQAFFARIRDVVRSFGALWASVAAPLALLQRISVPMPQTLDADPANPTQTVRSFVTSPSAPCLSQFNGRLLASAVLSSQVPVLHFRESMTLPIWVCVTAAWIWLCVGATSAVAAIRTRALEACAPADCDIQMTAISDTAANADEQMEEIERLSGVACVASVKGLGGREAAPESPPADICSSDGADRPFLGQNFANSLYAETHDAGATPAAAHSLDVRTKSPLPQVNAYEMGSADARMLKVILTGLLLLAFATAVIWIQMVAVELVAVLEVVGDISGIPHDLLGMTLLVWGNGLGDLASSLALGRSSQINTAMTAVYAGPLFDNLIALPVGFALWLGAAGQSHMKVELPASVVVGCIMLICQGIATLGVAGLYGGRLPHWFGTLSWALYAVYIAVTVGWVGP